MDSKSEVLGVLQECNVDAPAVPRRRVRGGKNSRAHRLEKYQQSKMMAATIMHCDHA